MKNKYFIHFLMIVVALPLAWYWISMHLEFKLLPTNVRSDIDIKPVLDGRSVHVDIFNNSRYTINNFKLVCGVNSQSDDCSLVDLISQVAQSQISVAGKNKGACLVTADNIVGESLIRSYILPGAKFNDYFEVKNLPPKGKISCFAEDVRGYQSFWFERLIGRAMD